MSAVATAPVVDPTIEQRGRVTALIVVEIFLIFFQGFMVAPLLPRLSEVFGVAVGAASSLVPAYTIPYGLVCLVIGPVADRYGAARVLRWLVLVGVVLPPLTATAGSFHSLIAWRVVTGLELGGIAPIALSIIARLFPYAERGRPMGWVFGAIAGGMAMGATFGPWLEPIVGWRGLFQLVGLCELAVAIPMWSTLCKLAAPAVVAPAFKPRTLVRGYVALLGSERGGKLYGYVFLNGVFHSGVFSWLGVYFTQRYHLSAREVGFALLGYGIPGFLLGPVIGRLADRFGRRWLIRGGLLLASLSALLLAGPLPTLGATAAITALSFGFDLTHPLLSGMVSALDPIRTAQAMALNTFAIFVGLGTGSVLFGVVYAVAGMATTLVLFAGFQLVLAIASFVLFDASWR